MELGALTESASMLSGRDSRYVLTCFPIARSGELGALAESASMLSDRDSRYLLPCFPIARSRDEAGARADIFLSLSASRGAGLPAPSSQLLAMKKQANTS